MRKNVPGSVNVPPQSELACVFLSLLPMRSGIGVFTLRACSDAYISLTSVAAANELLKFSDLRRFPNFRTASATQFSIHRFSSN